MGAVRIDSSFYCTAATFEFPTSGMTKETRVVAHMVFATCLKALVHLLMHRGEGQSSMNLSFLDLPLSRCLEESLC